MIYEESKLKWVILEGISPTPPLPPPSTNSLISFNQKSIKDISKQKQK